MLKAELGGFGKKNLRNCWDIAYWSYKGICSVRVWGPGLNRTLIGRLNRITTWGCSWQLVMSLYLLYNTAVPCRMFGFRSLFQHDSDFVTWFSDCFEVWVYVRWEYAAPVTSLPSNYLALNPFIFIVQVWTPSTAGLSPQISAMILPAVDILAFYFAPGVNIQWKRARSRRRGFAGSATAQERYANSSNTHLSWWWCSTAFDSTNTTLIPFANQCSTDSHPHRRMNLNPDGWWTKPLPYSC